MDLREKIKNILISKNFKVSEIYFLAGDASTRDYFVLEYNNSKFVLMHDPDKKSLEKFVRISRILNKFVTVPKIIEVFSDKNILIMEDFGKNKYSQILNSTNRENLYFIAVDALINVHSHKFINCVPSYTTEIFLNESMLFFDWYINKKFINDIDEYKNKFKDLFISLLKKIKKLPRVLIHRDYHVDNLFFLESRDSFLKCGWIDFQDALHGYCVYDILSLTQDARIDFPEKLENEIIKYYLEKFCYIDKDEFMFAYNLIAIQRHLKVLGIFSRLYKREHKQSYIKHIPRVESLLVKNLKKEAFFNLKHLLNPLVKHEI